MTFKAKITRVLGDGQVFVRTDEDLRAFDLNGHVLASGEIAVRQTSSGPGIKQRLRPFDVDGKVGDEVELTVIE